MPASRTGETRFSHGGAQHSAFSRACAAVAAWVLALPFAAALLLGALLSITDTVSVLLAFRSVRVPHRLAAIMEGESLFNDGTALVLVSVTTQMLSQGHFEASQAARALLVAIVGGVALGTAFGALGALVLRHTPDNLTAILASLVLVFGTSLAAEKVHASTVIAVVVVGVFVSRTARDLLDDHGRYDGAARGAPRRSEAHARALDRQIARSNAWQPAQVWRCAAASALGGWRIA